MIINNDAYCVYIHINKINGKMYVGITGRNPLLRWNYNGTGYIHCSKFWNAIQKYGWNNFDHIIFANSLTKDEAANMEKILIAKLNTIENGYNINEGGDACKHNPETIEKIRKANVGKTVSKETREKIRNARSKQTISMESIEKSAAKNRGKRRSDEFKNLSKEIKRQFMKKVFVIETGTVYESICEAARKLNVNKSSVSAVCNGKQESINGLHMQFVNA